MRVQRIVPNLVVPDVAPDVSVIVDDVDAALAEAQAAGVEIVQSPDR